MDQCEICKKPLGATEGVSLGGALHSRRIILCSAVGRCYDAANKILQKTAGIKTIKNAKELKNILKRMSDDRKHQDGF
jgi:hypothetical protein